MAEQHGKTLVPQIRFAGFTDPWEQRKLSDLTDRVSIQSSDSDLPQVEYEDIIPGEGTLNKDLRDKKGGKTGIKFYAGDVLYGKLRPYLMNWLYPQFNGVAVGDFWVLRATECDSSFLYRLVQTGSFQRLANVSSGSKMPRADWNLISQSFFAVPADHAEQKAIAKGLAELDTLITLHQRKYDKLQVLKKAMLEKMFPKNGSSVPEIRFKGFTDAWEQRKLGEVVKEVTRNDPTSEAPIMMITANNGFIEQSERYAFDNAGESLKKYILLQKGELAYNHGASKLRPFGSCFALTTAESARIPFVYHCFSAENQNAEFLSIELNGSEVESQLRKIVSSGARMDGLLNISFDEYSTVTVLLPDIKEQEHIADFFRNLDHLITLHQRELEKLQNIKKSMLEKMFV